MSRTIMATNHLPKKDMRDRLERWRSETGRTPMKRLSYMHDYSTPEGTVIRVHPVVHSPRLLQSLKRFDSVKKTTAAAPLSTRKQTWSPYIDSSQNKRVKIGKDGGLYRENQENVHPSVKPASKAQLYSLSTTKPSRREQLEKWTANRGSAVKNGHVTTVRTANTDVRRKRPPPPDPLGRTIFSTRAMKNPRRSCQPLRSTTSKANHVAYLRELKKQFQRDIDDTVTQILSEGDYQICDPDPMAESTSACGSDGAGAAVQDISDSLELARQLDFDSESLPFSSDQQAETDSSRLHGNDAKEIPMLLSTASSGRIGDQGYSGHQDGDESGSEGLSQVVGSSCPTPTTQHKLPRRRSHAHFDPSLMFKSTAIKYSMALSEPRRKRRHTYVAGTPDTKEVNRRLLHVTPVRRSTRRNRNGPGLTVDQSLCFDSPSQATTARGKEEDYEGVEVIPNKALGLGVVRSPNI